MVMKILVAFATRHGATQGIAERIAQALETDGFDVTLSPVDRLDSIAGHDAYVIGSAAYMGRWLKEASSFVRRHRETLAGHPVWFFSSGPVGPDVPDKHGVDPRKASEPREFVEFETLVPSRGREVFFGAYDPDLSPGTILGRLSTIIPAIQDALPAGDFRDWPSIEAWAHRIAAELTKDRDVELARGEPVSVIQR
jgi:menaquinone-dependent protoporphyrinogen oxidase